MILHCLFDLMRVWPVRRVGTAAAPVPAGGLCLLGAAQAGGAHVLQRVHWGGRSHAGLGLSMPCSTQETMCSALLTGCRGCLEGGWTSVCPQRLTCHPDGFSDIHLASETVGCKNKKISLPFTTFLTLLCLAMGTVCCTLSDLCVMSAGPLLSEEKWGCLVKTIEANYLSSLCC